ncbi:unnamed protein product [Didymodactylos carnosus]|uniref:EF-hand domain-containing protein n=2 Tax=Didymodactylos carnosus TaxID=1234261 RepID=A0A815FJ94_9BILA|nr:unnamed protein product [Didymodactylos carnosus]CAF4164530.1 unnamed protein product [Didymodactylos carnosus]
MGTNQSKTCLSEKDIHMIQKHTGLDREKIASWHQAFLTDCPRGTLNKEQFVRFYSELYPDAEKAKAYSQCVFRAFDQDKSGYIDDSDHNGYIDRGEMIKMLDAMFDMLNVDRRALENTPEYRVKIIMNALDHDMDDKISSEEFIEGVCRNDAIRKILLPD